MLIAELNPNDIVVALPATMVSMLVAVVLPVVVGFITKSSTSATLKAVLLALFSAVSAAITSATVTDGSAVITWGTLFAFIVTFVTAVGIHFGFLKPTGATAKVQAVGVHD